MIKETAKTQPKDQPIPSVEAAASVYCPICTHTVHAVVVTRGRTTFVRPDQRCPRCSASLAPGKVLWLDRAA